MITEIYEFWVFGPKMAVSWRTTAFQEKKGPKTPIFIVFFGFSFLGQDVKKGKFWKATQKRKNLTDNWKAIFWYCCCCFFWLPFFPFFCFFLGGGGGFWFLIQKNLGFPLEKGIFLWIFNVSLSFFLSLSWLPSFSVSLSLSLSFLLFFLYSFLSLFFAFFWFLVWVSFFILLSSLVFFHERNNIKIFNCKFFSSSIFSLF